LFATCNEDDMFGKLLLQKSNK